MSRLFWETMNLGMNNIKWKPEPTGWPKLIFYKANFSTKKYTIKPEGLHHFNQFLGI